MMNMRPIIKRIFPATGCGAIVIIAIATARAAPVASTDADAAIHAALAAVADQCPESYPEVDLRLPEPGGFSGKSDVDLLGLLDVWNPALRASVVAELGGRGKQALPALVEALSSDQAAQRRGALDALGRMVQDQLRNWQESLPDETNARAAQEKISHEFSDLLLERVLSLADDPDPTVRGGVLAMLGALGARGRDVSLAVLRLCVDEDEYLADQACIALEKEFGFGGLDQETLLPHLRRAMQNPLPRGKGHLVVLVGRSDESLQRALVPDLLAHLDWQPDRDTMFGAGGQARAVQLLTAHRVKELLPRIPALMDKPMRGPGLFDDCIAAIKAFGPEARPALPALQEKLAEMRNELDTLAPRNDRGSRARADQLRDRIASFEQALNHVES